MDRMLDLLFLTDTHSTAFARHACDLPKRQAPLARILVRKALQRLESDGITPDAIVLGGDLVDDGEAPDALADLQGLAGDLLKTGIPVYAVPGNHDGDSGRVARAFGTPPGLHRIGGYGLLLFEDAPVGDNVFERPAAQLALPERAAAEHPDLVLVAIQHHPLHPPIQSGYPYMLRNGDAVMASYRRGNVALSLSGHYHAGQSAHAVDGTVYATAPALAEEPFRFLHVRLDGRQATVRTLQLKLEVPDLWDIHCHTEFAYCATSVEAAPAILLSGRLGLGGLGIVEHAFHLYFPRDYAWSFRWQTEEDRVAEAWSHPRRSRMEAYRRFARALRSPFVRIGLEVDLRDNGELLLAPEDCGDWDFLIGAIHAIPGVKRGTVSQSKAEELFLRDVDRLLRHPVAVLAHPFRFLDQQGFAPPADLYVPIAERLAERGVAAEINVHCTTPNREFLRTCLDHGVRLALGTDSHKIEEVAELSPHLRILRDLGVDDAALPRLLYRP